MICGKWYDHKDTNKLNNTKNNLRLCNKSQNEANKPKTSKITSSKFKGVSWDKNRNKWFVKIKFHGQYINLGRYENEIEAAKVYDKKALELFGEFARINFPEETNN